LGEERDGLPQWLWGRRSRDATKDAINGGALEEELGGDVGGKVDGCEGFDADLMRSSDPCSRMRLGLAARGSMCGAQEQRKSGSRR